MNVQTNPGYFVKYEKIQNKNMSIIDPDTNGSVMSPHLAYLINLEQPDGTSQVVELTEAQAAALGIFLNGTVENGITDTVEVASSNPRRKPIKHSNKTFTSRKKVVVAENNAVTENNAVATCYDKYSKEDTPPSKPLGSCENPIEIIKDGEVLHSTQNLSDDYLQQIAQALQFETVKSEKEEKESVGDIPGVAQNIIYRVVYPEELDLKPKPEKPQKRGRPKKRTNEEELGTHLISESKLIKSVRTRSGRITRPPQYIKKDFKKIETSEVDNMETDLTTVDFEPLKTNQTSELTTPVKIKQLENHQRKRSIAAQFRCPKCQKAYLGHSKMLKHLQKHPDHGPIPDHCKLRHNDTWNYLIDLANKNPLGQRGVKFCKELATFLHNARLLAKLFFKRPSSVDKNLYFVDSALSDLLGIDSGHYILNENELQREVDMIAFVNTKCYNLDKEQNESTVNDGVNTDAKNESENCDLDVFVQKCHLNNQISEENSQSKDCSQNLAFDGSGRFLVNEAVENDFLKNSKENSENVKSDNPLNGTSFHQNKNTFDAVQNSDHNGFSLNCDITSVKSFDPELQKFDEHIMDDFGSRSTSENCKSRSSHLDVSVTSHSDVQITHVKPISSDDSLHSELMSDNSLLNSLPNFRTSVDELILTNVDTAQVTSLLDNSTSSDEVMNVDQFVNERFKNLTESDLELPNTSLNLDLPSLDLFQFHTS